MERNIALEKYTNEISKVLLDRYAKLLVLSREILMKTETKENLKNFNDILKIEQDIKFNDCIVLSDENIAELIHILKESINSNGLHGLIGSLPGWVESQLRDSNDEKNGII